MMDYLGATAWMFDRVCEAMEAPMSHDRECRRLAEHFLRDYDLSATELAQETDRLAETIQRVIEDEIGEALAHRKRE